MYEPLAFSGCLQDLTRAFSPVEFCEAIEEPQSAKEFEEVALGTWKHMLSMQKAAFEGSPCRALFYRPKN